MFQRLRGAIDSRIAEEQARQRSSQSSLSRSNSGTQRPNSRPASPSKRSLQAKDRERRNGDSTQKSPDPSEFESEFVIDDEDVPSRAGTPRPIHEKIEDTRALEVPAEGGPEAVSNDAQDMQAKEAPTSTPSELPSDVRMKLRRLAKFESKYQELLRSYRIAHARVLTIEPFETSLRENTPLTSINDPGALVEYLNQLNLKGDMVLDELKRVSSERDSLKQKCTQAEKSTREAWDEATKLRDQGSTLSANETLRSNDGTFARGPAERDLTEAPPKSPSVSIKSRTSSIPSLSLFSPKAKPFEAPKVKAESEEFFSYEQEVPRIDTGLRERQDDAESLQREVQSLQVDLAVARESTQNMVQTLEESMREMNAHKELKDRCEVMLVEQRDTSDHLLKSLKSDLQARQEELHVLKTRHSSQDTEVIANLETQLHQATRELEKLRSEEKSSSTENERAIQLQENLNDMEAEVSKLRAVGAQNEKRIETLNGLVKNLRTQLAEAEESKQVLQEQTQNENKKVEVLQPTVAGPKVKSKSKADAGTDVQGTATAESVITESHAAVDTTNSGKKRNKKKKKAGKPANEQRVDDSQNTSEVIIEEKGLVDRAVDPDVLAMQSNTVARLQEELDHLRKLLEEKDASIERMHGKLKQEEDLREEIETLRDELINMGQEHVDSKDMVKELIAEKHVTERTVIDLEKALADSRGAHASSTAGSEQKHNELVKEFEDLDIQATSMRTDLAAASQLASSRFKELSDLRTVLQKAQPELVRLRTEVADLESIKNELSEKQAEVSQLGSKQESMHSEMVELRRTAAERNSEIKELNHKFVLEKNSRYEAEETTNKMTGELQRMETEKKQAIESLDRLARDLSTSQEELTTSRTRLRDLEQQVSSFNRDSEALKEDIELKTAQYASAQSLMGSMRDQTAEMAMQTKEARDRCESLEEEVADAHRLLNERSREGDTMRRLLADAETRTDSRIREMKDRMDVAIEDRDRAEDEASTAARRRARELEDMRNKTREAEKGLKRAEEDKEELEVAQRDWKRRREELEQKLEQSTQEAEEVRKAMSELRDALDDSERQARELEKERLDLQRSVESEQHKFEKLQKSYKAIADDKRSTQTVRTKAMESGAQSSRSSLDSVPSRARLNSPVPKSRNSSTTLIDSPNGQIPSMDYVYLKNVLLQFLEQRDKKHQMQLIPVLGILLHFDRLDEQKWMAAITTK